MAGFPRFRFLAIATVFHVVYIFSIFDIYFVSPVVSGMRLFQVERPAEAKAPADRLVLFVGTCSACSPTASAPERPRLPARRRVSLSLSLSPALG